MTTTVRKNAPRFINDTQVQVTKEFEKKARIFGTAEYELWKEIRKDCPNAEMVTKNIKKNPNKKTSTRNMTYENMAKYIRAQDNAEMLMMEFQKQIECSKVQTNPYRCVLAWFKQKFEGYDNYKDYFKNIAQEVAEEKSIFTLNDNDVEYVEEKEDGNVIPLNPNKVNSTNEELDLVG